MEELSGPVRSLERAGLCRSAPPHPHQFVEALQLRAAAARTGKQTGAAYARVKRNPSAAIRSMFGVRRRTTHAEKLSPVHLIQQL